MQFGREQIRKWFKHPNCDAEYLIGFLPVEARRGVIDAVAKPIEAGEINVARFNTMLLSRVLFGWRNIDDADGKPLEFSADAIFYLYENDGQAQWHDHAEWIQEQAGIKRNFDDAEQVLKNLSAPLNGAAHSQRPQPSIA